MISRPIRQLLEKIRQVSEGELQAIVKLPQQATMAAPPARE